MKEIIEFLNFVGAVSRCALEIVSMVGYSE